MPSPAGSKPPRGRGKPPNKAKRGAGGAKGKAKQPPGRKSPTQSRRGSAKRGRPAPKPRRESRRPSRAAKSSQRGVSSWGRLAPVYDVDGPRIRLGVLWFFVALPAVAISPATAALVYGGTAAWAARQTVKAWRGADWQADLAAVLAAVPVAAAVAGRAPGFGALALVTVAALLAGINAPAAGLRGSSGHVAAAGVLVQAIVPASFAAMCMVLVRDVSPDTAVVLLGLASVYEMGDFLVGSGASNSVEGPLAGMAAVIVVAFPLALLLVEPFDVMKMPLVGVAALACPIGQWVATAVLPRADANASALRRIDTLLVLAPIWAAASGAF